MKRAVASSGLLVVLAATLIPHVAMTDSTCGTTASDVRSSPAPCPTPNPNQAAIDQLKARLGSDIANALATEQKLSRALDQTYASEQVLTEQIAQEEARIAQVQAEITKLDAQIGDTQARIDVERAQIAALARDIYRQPTSLLELIARTGSLRDALTATMDLVVAGQRADALKARLQADLAKLQADRKQRLAELDSENAIRDQLVSSMNELDNLKSLMDSLGAQLNDVIGRIQAAVDGLQGQPLSVTESLATVLEQEEQTLIQQADQAAWNQAQVGAGLAVVTGLLPPGTNLTPLTLYWPMIGAHITQPFGPTNVVLEPPLFGYPHFHTGIDLAAPLGTPVLAAADGVVVVVAHTNIGYGNYVMIAHGGGVITLYAHLLETDVSVGDKVSHGRKIGLEGSTGLSTGPHLHFEVRINDHVVDPLRYLPPLTATLPSSP